MKELAKKILIDVLGITPKKITRFTTGYCHYVFCAETENGEKYTLRITNKANKEYYLGSVKWLPKLCELGLPVPKIIRHGEYENVNFALLTFFDGKDLGKVYGSLTDAQKKEIARELNAIQKKVRQLKSDEYGYTIGQKYKTWKQFIGNAIDRECKRIQDNGIFDLELCDKVKCLMNDFEGYFSTVKPLAFLDDTTTKNVIIHNGKLAGIVDVDEICFGDPLRVVALTNMALLSMKLDTKYIDYWLDEMNATETQRKAMTFYTLINCIGFMGEQGMTFDNGIKVKAEQEKTEHLKSIYNDLIKQL